MMYPPQAVAYPPQAQQAPQAPQQALQEAFVSRLVTSREEALATPVDYTKPVVMLDAGHGMIYVKVFNSQTGLSDFLDFARAIPEQPKPTPKYATVEELAALREEFEKLKKPIGKGKKTDEE